MSYEGGRKTIARAVNKMPLRHWAAPALSAVLTAVLVILISGPSVRRSGLEREVIAEPGGGTGLPAGTQLDGKIAGVEEALKTAPEDLKTLFEAGLLKFRKGPAFYPDAIANLEKARQLGLADERLFYYLGVMYQGVGLYDFACEEYRKFLRNRPGDFEISMRLAKLDYAALRFSEAVRDYELLKLKYPKNPVVLENLTLALWKNNQDYSQNLLELKGLGFEAAFRAAYVEGIIAYELKDYSRAGRLLKSALSDAKYSAFIDRVRAYWLLGDSALKLKDNDGAFAAFTELLSLNPSHEEAKSLLARLEKARKTDAKKKVNGG